MRLTKKCGSIYKYNFDTHCDGATRELRSIETHNKIVNKLGQYEDVEELCEKIGKQPIYLKFDNDTNNYICKVDYTSCSITYNLSTKQIEIYNYERVNTLSIDKYSKTWSFTREELECD